MSIEQQAFEVGLEQTLKDWAGSWDNPVGYALYFNGKRFGPKVFQTHGQALSWFSRNIYHKKAFGEAIRGMCGQSLDLKELTKIRKRLLDQGILEVREV